jgi:hypothetical protein
MCGFFLTIARELLASGRIRERRFMRDDALVADLSRLETLRQVLNWSMARSPRAEFVDVVIQDEYHHDVVVRISDVVYAVFETS